MLKKIFLLPLLLLSITLLIFAGLVFTQSGLEFSLFLTGKYLGSLNVKEAKGNLYNGFVLKKINYHDQYTNILADTISIKYRISLSMKKIDIDDLQIDDLSISNSAQDKQSGTTFKPSWFKHFSLHNLKMNNVTYMQDSRKIKIIDLVYNNHLLKVTTPKGVLNGMININLIPVLSWQARITSHKLELNEFLPDYPGEINLALETSGKWRDGKLIIGKSIFNIFDSQFFAEGSVGNKWDLVWKANIPALNRYIKTLHGNMMASGKILGDRKFPHFNMTVQGKSLKYDDIALPDFHSLINLKHDGRFHGQLKSGTNVIIIDGDVLNKDSGISFNVNLVGDHLQLKKSKMYNILFSPTLNISYKNEIFGTNGKIIIHKAKITPPDFTKVTTLPDEVVIEQNKKPADSGMHNLKYNIDLDIDKTKFTYNNLDVKLKGLLRIIQTPNRLPIATGTLYIVDGHYKIYQRTLKISQGKLVYAGNLLSNPSLDIKATRQFDNIAYSESKSQFNNDKIQSVYSGTEKLTVGVNVSGSATAPRVSLFSEPGGLSQNDLISWLVFGAPASQITSASSLVILNDIAASLHSGSSPGKLAKVKNNIEKKLHLNELSIGSSEVYDPVNNISSQTTTLNIGKNIGKNLSIHYKAGIFTPFSILTMQYKINNNFTIRTEASSVETGADLLYEIEFE